MTFLIISFIAGVLTILAPCVLPLLPVIVGSSATSRSRSTPYIVVASLAVSIILFTYLLKASAALISIPEGVWMFISGGILLFFGLTIVIPGLWENIPGIARLSRGSNKLMGVGYQEKSVAGDILIGAALGPVFSTCSPTYFVILASVLPTSFALGSLYLFAYVIGLCAILLPIAVLGDRIVSRLAWLSDPEGWFKRIMGVLFIVLGLAIMFGFEKKLEAKILSSGFFDVTTIEQSLLQSAHNSSASQKGQHGTPYVEIANPSGFVNTGTNPDGTDKSITIGQFVGKDVVLVDFMTYSCINCQRTLPYIEKWYDTYKDQGLQIIAIHTPEFAFEKDINNVREAMQRLGVKYPVVLDNDYGTWKAYGNEYWPHKYLIDIHGNIVYDHIGEGGYDETEQEIKTLLQERATVLGTTTQISSALSADTVQTPSIAANSPETYFGSGRNEFLGNGTQGLAGTQKLVLPSSTFLNTLYLGGTWDFSNEYASPAAGASVVYRYAARDVYLVASASSTADIEVLQDGKPVGDAAGDDVSPQGMLTVTKSRLYHVIHNMMPGEHMLELHIKGTGLQCYTFTFG